MKSPWELTNKSWLGTKLLVHALHTFLAAGHRLLGGAVFARDQIPYEDLPTEVPRLVGEQT